MPESVNSIPKIVGYKQRYGNRGELQVGAA